MLKLTSKKARRTMTQTKKVSVTTAYQEVADSATAPLVTVQNQSDQSVGVVIDDRTQAVRVTELDDVDYLIPAGQERTFNYAGKINVRSFSSRAEGYVVAVLL